MLAFNLQLRELLHPVTKTAGWVGATAKASLQREPGDEPRRRRTARPKAADKGAGVPVMDAGKAVAPSPLVAGVGSRGRRIEHPRRARAADRRRRR